MGFRALDHTADLGLHVEAETLPELFVEALRGLTDCLTELDAVEVRCRRRIALERAASAGDADLELLLVDFLSEALVALDSEQMLYCHGRLEIERAGDRWRLSGELAGERYDPARHRFKIPIKGVTYHRLSVRRAKSGWHAEVIFDV